MPETTYTVKVTCLNCEWKGEVKIPTGTPISKQPCPNCGCRELEKDIE